MKNDRGHAKMNNINVDNTFKYRVIYIHINTTRYWSACSSECSVLWLFWWPTASCPCRRHSGKPSGHWDNAGRHTHTPCPYRRLCHRILCWPIVIGGGPRFFYGVLWAASWFGVLLTMAVTFSNFLIKISVVTKFYDWKDSYIWLYLYINIYITVHTIYMSCLYLDNFAEAYLSFFISCLYLGYINQYIVGILIYQLVFLNKI